MTDTISVTDQNTSEMTPNTSPGVGRTAPLSIENTVCRAYNGLVPISPKTTPSAPSINAPAATRRTFPGPPAFFGAAAGPSSVPASEGSLVAASDSSRVADAPDALEVIVKPYDRRDTRRRSRR